MGTWATILCVGLTRGGSISTTGNEVIDSGLDGFSRGAQGVVNAFTGGLFWPEYGAFYDGFNQQWSGLNSDPNNDDPSFRTGQNAGRTSVACLAAAGGLRAARFRGPEWGRWKDTGQWQEGPHFHLDRGKGLGDHHLPQQGWRFWKNLKDVIGKWWND